MAQADIPNNGEPYNPNQNNLPQGTVVQVSDPMRDVRGNHPPSGLPDGKEPNPQVRKKLVHPFPLGQLHDNTLEPPRQVLGQVANPQMPGRTFEISILGNGQPVVQSNQTANFWTISWSTLIKLALAEGIERQLKAPKPKLVDGFGDSISSDDPGK
jgi:hypothetical protein